LRAKAHSLTFSKVALLLTYGLLLFALFAPVAKFNSRLHVEMWGESEKKAGRN
jgi:hypothetical protein